LLLEVTKHPAMRESDYGDPATSAQTTAAASAVSMEHIAMIRGSDEPGQ